MSVRRLSNSFISTEGRGKSSTLLAGYSPAIDEMDLIERVVVGSGGAANVTFSNIPQIYTHLHLRCTVRSARSNTRDNMILRVGNNTIDSGNNYAYNFIQGLGSGAGYGTASSVGYALLQYAPGAQANSNSFGTSVIDILEYKNSTKTKVIRSVGGFDNVGDSNLGIDFSSGLWNSTSAINILQVYAFNANLVQHSNVSLYGVKA